ncbi:SLBB domain-containing protein [Guggenheimella bovis]
MKKIAIIIGVILLFLFGLFQHFYSFTPIVGSADTTITVHIAGAVKNPGVYTLSKTSRLNELVKEAGGLLVNSDDREVNLAKKLVDGEKIEIPERREVKVEEAPKEQGLGDITKEEWDTVNGVGKVLSERIVTYLKENPHAKVEDLKNVEGIKEKTFQNLKEFLRSRGF